MIYKLKWTKKLPTYYTFLAGKHSEIVTDIDLWEVVRELEKNFPDYTVKIVEVDIDDNILREVTNDN